MNLVAFVGAGFSVPFGLPTMDSFLGFADSSRRLDSADRALLRDLVLEARRANSFRESSPTNLEDILSFAEMGHRLALTPPEANRSEHLKSLVQKVFATPVTVTSFWEQYDDVIPLLGRSPSEIPRDLAFVTTNYDLNIECACHRAGWSSSPGFALHRIEGVSRAQGHLSHEDGVPVFKLHGSVNWYLNHEDGVPITIDDRLVLTTEGPALPRVSLDGYRAPSAPHIVPPSFLKPEMSPALRATWAGGARVLSTANVVAFIGYSFPPSDTEMSFFLARALSENSALRRILVIDPRADEIVARLKDPRGQMGSHFRHLLKALPFPWEKVDGPIEAHM